MAASGTQTVTASSTDKQLEIIASLSVKAPDHDIRACIRKYNPENTTHQHEKCFTGSGVKKEILRSTLDYLGIKAPGGLNKKPLACMLICRIQTLLPDTCVFCKQEYSVDPNDTPLLTCRICSQGSHDECVRKHISDSTGQDLSDDEKSEKSRADTQKKVKSIINPLNIPGMHYICHACEDERLPEASTPTGLVTTEDNAAVEPEERDDDNEKDDEENDDDDDEDDDDDDDAEKRKSSGSDRITLSKQNAKSDDKITPKGSTKGNSNTKDEENDSSQYPTNICPQYAMGKCRHGMSGKGCSKNHPRPCRKLLRHGPKSRNLPDGCPGFPTCSKWHPKLCRTSVKKRECTHEGCKFRHIAGTRRTKDDKVESKKFPATTNTNSKNSAKVDSDQTGHFLEVMESWKKEFMETIEAKIRSVQMPPYPQNPYSYPPMFLTQYPVQAPLDNTRMQMQMPRAQPQYQPQYQHQPIFVQ